MTMHVFRVFSILLGMLTCPCDTIIPGSRLLDFPNPDFSRTLTFPTHDGQRQVRVEHKFGKLPFHVRVYATARDGLNKKFVFEATGGCQNDERPASGLVFGYDDTSVTVWAPRSASSRRTGDGSMIYIGEPWGGIRGGGHSQDSKTVSLTIEVWRSGPMPTYETNINIDTAARSTFHVSHTLRQIPELVSVRVTPKIQEWGRRSPEWDGMHFHGVGSVHSSGSRRTGGVVFAYNVHSVVLWTSKNPKSGCVFIGKNWRRGGVFSARQCRVEIRLWLNSFPPPVYQSDWTSVSVGKDHPSFLEVRHNIRMLPTHVRVQYRFSDTVDPLVFEGIGSVQSSRVRNRFGGLVFGYDKFKVRVWLPWSPAGRRDEASVIFVGDGWGDGDAVYNKTAQFRVQVMADKCHDATRVVDGQGYCRDITEVHLRPLMSSWDRCSQPCGTGMQKRKVKGCTGVSLRTIIHCTFSANEENCGLNPIHDPSKFPWLRSHDNGLYGRKTVCSNTPKDAEEESERNAFLDEVKLRHSNFVFSQPKTCDKRKRVWVNRRQGLLESRDLGNATGCILTFKYTARSYFHRFQIDVMPSRQETYPEDMEPLWMLEGGNVQPGVWRSAYLNIGHHYPSIRKFRFVHKLPYTNPSRNPELNPKCPGQCHSVLLSEVKLMCEVGDAYRVGEKKCAEKKLPKPSCIVDAFEPFAKGPAWSVVHSVRNIDNTNLGHFVSANGSRGDLIASYVFNVVVSDVYHLWFESFSVSNETNDITIEILGHDKFDDYLIYNGERPIWLPLVHKLKFSAGVHTIKLYQREKQFKFRNLMISPRSISVYSALGMQSQLIPNSNFNTLSMINTLLGYARLNGIGAWAPTDKSTGQMFFEVQFPEVALVNKIATQGGRSLDRGRRGASFEGYMQSYRLKFSLHHKIIRESFAYYRENIKEKYPYEFPANKDVDSIVEHKLKFTIVARAVRLYPINFTWPLALRVEVYGFYMLKGMCPDIPIKIRERECAGDGVCSNPNQQCFNDTINLTSTCECNKGFYGNKCEKTGCAGQPCVNGSCVEIGGSFQCNCQPGFYGRYCHLPCPKGRFGVGCVHHCNCSTKEHCNATTGHCSCPPGYQGNRCRDKCQNNTFGQNCSMKCNCPTPLQCQHVDGSCYCPHGFHGDQCDVRCRNETFGKNCTQRCDCQNKGVCNEDGKCDCPPGWFGDQCEEGCPAGWFGHMCHHQCHRQGNARCDPVTGEQTCVEGFMGRFCNKRCPEGRYGVNCVHKCQCEMTNTLQCTKDQGGCHCKPGWRGKNCESKCHETWGPQCAHACECQNGGICDHVTGRCTCLRGHNGTRCENQCDGGQYGQGCMKTGSCAQGHFGLQCKEVCDCNPETTDECDPGNGKCFCDPGHEGERCEEKCDRNHYGKNCAALCRCENEATCDNKDGFCYCQPGWRGDFCEQECEEGTYGGNCKLKCKCQNGAHCAKTDGSCKCAPGYQGSFCEKPCDAGTYGNGCQHKCQCDASTSVACDNVNGSCTCKPGYKGTFCEELCDDGYYGNGCQQPCPLCRHANHACNKINGTCSCIEGFTGPHCMDDCPMSRYGPGCAQKCLCNSTELCDNLDGTCYPAPDFVFHLNILFNCYALQSQRFVALKDKLKENTALLVYNCLTEDGVAPHCLHTNETKYSVISDHRWSTDNREEVLREIGLVNTFFVRIVSMVPKYSSQNEPVCAVSMSLLNNTKPVNGTVIEAMLVQLPMGVVTKALTYMQERVYLYYRGVTYDEKRRMDEIMTKMQWIVIGLSSFGGLLTVFLVCLICRCTKRAPYPPPFQKVRRDSKDFEMQVNMTCNSHLLAFENPYYDVIAAMGLDDDIEEDYYNPLYDNMYGIHPNSDSETEPEDMYYFFRNNNYHRDTFHTDSTHYSYDKDSGFSSGHLM